MLFLNLHFACEGTGIERSLSNFLEVTRSIAVDPGPQSKKSAVSNPALHYSTVLSAQGLNRSAERVCVGPALLMF